MRFQQHLRFLGQSSCQVASCWFIVHMVYCRWYPQFHVLNCFQLFVILCCNSGALQGDTLQPSHLCSILWHNKLSLRAVAHVKFFITMARLALIGSGIWMVGWSRGSHGSHQVRQPSVAGSTGPSGQKCLLHVANQLFLDLGQCASPAKCHSFGLDVLVIALCLVRATHLHEVVLGSAQKEGCQRETPKRVICYFPALVEPESLPSI
jgi:hypothetical protein